MTLFAQVLRDGGGVLHCLFKGLDTFMGLVGIPDDVGYEAKFWRLRCLKHSYRGLPVPVTGAYGAPQRIGLHGLGAVTRKREPL
jgi:hypothetical protein